MTTTRPAATRPYHHGDLRNALVEAGVELARAGGPQAIVLREAARQVGVSPNAAYRHFADLTDLVQAVADRAFIALADSMRAEIAICEQTGEAEDTWSYVCAVGRGYVHFALNEPGLFRTAFDRLGEAHPEDTSEPVPDSPQALLTGALDRLVVAGLLPLDEVESARMLAWSSVHGLSLLLLGPMAELAGAEREQVINSTLDQIGKGLLPDLPVERIRARRRR